MIVVTVELWPGGLRNRSKELARMYIGNDGTGAQGKGHYDIAVMRRGERRAPWEHGYGGNAVAKPIRVGRVENHARQSLHVLILVAKAIAATFEKAPKVVEYGYHIGEHVIDEHPPDPGEASIPGDIQDPPFPAMPAERIRVRGNRVDPYELGEALEHIRKLTRLPIIPHTPKASRILIDEAKRFVDAYKDWFSELPETSEK